MALMPQTNNNHSTRLRQLRNLELQEPYYLLLDRDAAKVYSKSMILEYSRFYDSIITDRSIPLPLKEDIEDWYVRYREFFGTILTPEINKRLETLLDRFGIV